jgi:hypothetical protein
VKGASKGKEGSEMKKDEAQGKERKELLPEMGWKENRREMDRRPSDACDNWDETQRAMLELIGEEIEKGVQEESGVDLKLEMISNSIY